MTADTDLHPLAQAYLGRLAESARSLPRDDAAELVADISDHLREALPATPSEAEVRTVLDRLGTPQELVTAAGGPASHPGAPPTREPRFGAVEILALVGLVGAELLFVILPLAVLLWLAGVVLLAVSRVWSGAQKAWGLAALATGLPVAFTVLALPVSGGTTTCSAEVVSTEVGPDGAVSSTVPSTCVTEGGWPDWAFTIVQVLFVAYLCVQVWTLWRLTRRR
jgi:uncharacterized membrane protein